MTPATCEELLAWVMEHEPPTGDVMHRLEAYARTQVSDDATRDGWISLGLA